MLRAKEALARPTTRVALLLALLTLAALLIRLQTVSWHALYPLSGDEGGFFEQARAFVQGRGYHELELMRGPAYPLFVAVIFRLCGTEIGAVRLVQALLGTAMVPLFYLWANHRHGRRAGLAAATLSAFYFAPALQSTFLLTETLFLFLYLLGMVLLDRQLERPTWWTSALTGAAFALATLTRSVGLPLIGLAAAAMFLPPSAPAPVFPSPPPPVAPSGRSRLRSLGLAGLVLAAAALVIAPWTVRNAVVHKAFIIVDTTGATNLWLDNDPVLGRDAVKRELLKYPEGERQGLALQSGLAAIGANPGWFLEKCWNEAREFFALEYTDDFLARPAIWYPQGEVWARVFLGDGLYLLLVAGGLVGLAGSRTRLKVLDLLWLAYVLGSSMLFHVELRYRLPFILALVPYAGAALAHPRQVLACLRGRPVRLVLAGLSLLAFGGVLLAHANYPALYYRVALKRVHVALGERSFRRGDLASAAEQARTALDIYSESAEARVLLARALHAQGQDEEAERVLRQAVAYRSGHPHPHLLLGDLLRQQGRVAEALPELAYERNSLQDLQQWAWETFATPPTPALDLGTGLELGHIRGWHLPEQTGEGVSFRWSDEHVVFRLAAPGAGPARLHLRLAAGRPEGLPSPQVEIWLDGRVLGRLTVENGWHDYTVEVPTVAPGDVLCLELRSSTFRPHAHDPHLDDNRALGVMVALLELSR